MAFNLDRTLNWAEIRENPESPADVAFLTELQGNILKGHGREHTSNIFIRFNDAEAGRKLLVSLEPKITFAYEALKEADYFNDTHLVGEPFIAVFLTADGYRFLGLDEKMPDDEAFRAGMVTRAGLNDPPSAEWDGFLLSPHCMIMVAASDQREEGASKTVTNGAARDAAAASMIEWLRGSGAIESCEQQLGDALFNADGNGIEHFGYVDGRSQPLMLEDELIKEESVNWSPRIPLSQVIVPDKGGNLEVSCGSYFVFRKLRQDVREFKVREEQLFIEAGMQGKKDRAGASIVGRFENGWPVALPNPPKTVAGKVIDNDFNYKNDPEGLQCPFSAHIRKTNPRRPELMANLMARRGIPYGLRTDDPNGEDKEKMPAAGAEVGLLFMSYQSDLSVGFETTQIRWANAENFDFLPTALQPVGKDPVIGQGPGSKNRYPIEYGKKPLSQPVEFGNFVHMQGGAYFFAPSRSFFKQLP